MPTSTLAAFGASSALSSCVPLIGVPSAMRIICSEMSVSRSVHLSVRSSVRSVDQSISIQSIDRSISLQWMDRSVEQ
eukprot:10954-Rhodomonas_salina.1